MNLLKFPMKYEAQCDAANNPPTTLDKTVYVTVRIQAANTRLYFVRVPIDLEKLVAGTLKTVDVEYLR